MAADLPTPPEARARRAQDLELVRRTLAGDRAAVEGFLDRMKCVRAFVAARNAACGRPLGVGELEDTVQDTLLALWTKRETFAGAGSLEAWAYRFSQLEFLNRLQSLRRRPRLLEDVEAQRVAQPAPRAVDLPEEERLYRALAQLDEHAAELLRAKHIDALTFEELAARAQEPVNTIKTRYYRALEKLRVALGVPAHATRSEEEA